MLPVSCYQPSKPGLLITPSCSIVCQNDSQNSGKPCRWESCVVIMGINEQSGKEMLGPEVRRVRSTGPSVPVEPGVPLVPLWTHGQGDSRLLRLNHYMSGIEPVGHLLVLGLVQSFSFFRDSIPLCFPGVLPLATDAGCSCFLLGLQGYATMQAWLLSHWLVSLMTPHPEAVLKLPTSHTMNTTDSLVKERLGQGSDVVWARNWGKRHSVSSSLHTHISKS